MLTGALSGSRSTGRGDVRGAARAERAHEIRGRGETVALEVPREARVHLLRCERIVEERRAEPNRRRAGEHELDGVVSRLDAALADDRNAVWPAHLRYLIHLEERDRPDRG